MFGWVGRRFLKMITQFIELKVEADRANAMVKNSPTGMIFADDDEVVQYVNPAFVELAHKLGDALPVKADDIVGSKLSAFHRDHRPPGADHRERAAAPGHACSSARSGSTSWSTRSTTKPATASAR